MIERVISYGGHFGKILNPSSMDVYLAKIFAVRYTIILVGLISTLQMLDLLAKSEEILAGKGASYADLWSYVKLRTPHLISLFSPCVALLTSVLTLSVLNVHSEIVVMKAAGWSAFRIIIPLMIVSLFIATLNFVFSETVTVHARAELRNWEGNNFDADIPPAPNAVYDTWVTDGQNLVKAESASAWADERLLISDTGTEASITSSGSRICGAPPIIAITPGALSFNSITTLWAVLGPTPLAAFKALQSPSAIARLTPSGPKAPKIESDAFAPIPCTDINKRCHSFSTNEVKPNSCSKSSLTSKSV